MDCTAPGRSTRWTRARGLRLGRRRRRRAVPAFQSPKASRIAASIAARVEAPDDVEVRRAPRRSSRRRSPGPGRPCSPGARLRRREQAAVGVAGIEHARGTSPGRAAAAGSWRSRAARSLSAFSRASSDSGKLRVARHVGDQARPSPAPNSESTSPAISVRSAPDVDVERAAHARGRLRDLRARVRVVVPSRRASPVRSASQTCFGASRRRCRPGRPARRVTFGTCAVRRRGSPPSRCRA